MGAVIIIMIAQASLDLGVLTLGEWNLPGL